MEIKIKISPSSYEDDYNIYTTEKLKSLMDDKNYIHGDIVIRGNEITSLGSLKKVYGNLGIDSNSIMNLGELNYVKGDFWITTGNKLKSLGFLERVGGSLSLRRSEVTDLGKLFKVGDQLSLRDTKIENISGLQSVKKLFLPKRLKDLNIDFIEKKQVRYWSDEKIPGQKQKQIKLQTIEDVGGDHLRYEIIIPYKSKKKSSIQEKLGHFIKFEGFRDTSNDIDWDSKQGFGVKLMDLGIPTSPMKKYFVSKKTQDLQIKNLEFYKNKIENVPGFIDQFKNDYSLLKLLDRLVYDLLFLLVNGKILIKEFINKSYFYLKVFSKVPNYNLINDLVKLFKLLKEDQIIYDLVKNYELTMTMSNILSLEIKLKKRLLTGKRIVQNTESGLNDFIQQNITEYYSFINDVLDELYGTNYSLIHSLFGKSKTQKSEKTFEKIHRIVFDSQNDFREKKGLPKIGEGWISETELYYLLKNEFPNETLLHHGKPKWLGRQHVDIWFPDKNIGVEYQGLQHDQPVDFFGGEEGFKKGQERDDRKKSLFKKNKSHLIEVRKGYNLDEVVEQIKSFM
tara:strand:- start:57 stop:1751 length:1695 start_codon:yes stop_codon:yes gene_type:complete